MPLYKAQSTPFDKKVKAVRTYLEEERSLQAIAHAFGISHVTLGRWIRKYREEGEEALKPRKTSYMKSWKRLPINIEVKIMFLKERNPSLSIDGARQLVKRAGIEISNKGIWGIWRRYGLSNRSIENPLSPFGVSTPESEDGLRKAKMFVRNGDLRSAAKILNNLPTLPKDLVIKHIPERLLSTRRKLDRLSLEFQEIPCVEYARKARNIRKALEKNGYIYSSIIASFLELQALDTMRKPRKQKQVLNLLGRKMRRVRDSSLWFLFHFQQASTYVYLSKINKAMEILEKCREFVYRHPYPFYYDALGALLTTVGYYKEASRFYENALKSETDRRSMEYFAMAMVLYGHSMAGQYSEGNKILNSLQTLKNHPISGAAYSLARAYMSFGQGSLIDTRRFLLNTLDKASKGRLYNLLYATAVGLAAVAAATNKEQEAKTHLKKYLPLLKKQELVSEESILKSLLGSAGNIPKEFTQIPPFYLLDLLLQANHTMRISDYRKAYHYAKRRGLLGLLHRWIVFFPKPILQMLEKGKSTGLPKAILEFPIFNREAPVFYIKLLGRLMVYKNRKYLTVRLTPKERALLIYLALKAGAPSGSIGLNDLYHNFWPHNKNPRAPLSLLLTRLKSKLRLPGHLFSISRRYGEPKLINNGILFVTDYGDFETLLTQIKTLNRADEWRFAEREYLRAFRLFRGVPFEKVYDNWSDNMRIVILNQLEIAAIDFVRIYSEHKHAYPSRFLVTAKGKLENIHRIIPHSKEIKHFLEKC